jgi:hypothetical protein
MHHKGARDNGKRSPGVAIILSFLVAACSGREFSPDQGTPDGALPEAEAAREAGSAGPDGGVASGSAAQSRVDVVSGRGSGESGRMQAAFVIGGPGRLAPGVSSTGRYRVSLRQVPRSP